MAKKSAYDYMVAMELFEERLVYWRNRAIVAEERVDKLTDDLEKANADNAALVRRNVENVQAVKREAV